MLSLDLQPYTTQPQDKSANQKEESHLRWVADMWNTTINSLKGKKEYILVALCIAGAAIIANGLQKDEQKIIAITAILVVGLVIFLIVFIANKFTQKKKEEPPKTQVTEKKGVSPISTKSL